MTSTCIFSNAIGKYVYMEASSTNENSIYEGNVARLVSPIVQVPRVCFGMYYHMWGEDMGSLRINLIFSNGTKQNKWSTSENKNNRWLQLQLSISSVVSYKVSKNNVDCVLNSLSAFYTRQNIPLDVGANCCLCHLIHK